MIYVTYDLPQRKTGGTAPGEPVIRGAQEIQAPGPLVRWKVGPFENASGVTVHGIQIEYVDPVIGPAETLVELPATAENVQVHREGLPAEYRSALKNAA